MKTGKLGWIAGLACVVLAGCGGGGGGSTSSDPGPDYTSKYVGTWKSGCHHNDMVFDAMTGLGAYFIRTNVVTRTSNTGLKIATTDQIFASSDTICAQASLGSMVHNGSGDGSLSASATGMVLGTGITMAIDGQTTVDGKTVDKVTYSEEALTGLSNATITAGTGNKFKIEIADFAAYTVKHLIYNNGTTWTLGDHTGVADGQYPTMLQTSPFYTKQ